MVVQKFPFMNCVDFLCQVWMDPVLGAERVKGIRPGPRGKEPPDTPGPRVFCFLWIFF